MIIVKFWKSLVTISDSYSDQWILTSFYSNQKKTNGYGSIPIHTIFWGDEHPFTSYFDVHYGDRVLTHPQMAGPGPGAPWLATQRLRATGQRGGGTRACGEGAYGPGCPSGRGWVPLGSNWLQPQVMWVKHQPSPRRTINGWYVYHSSWLVYDVYACLWQWHCFFPV